MSKKYRIIKCSDSLITWYEVDRKGLFFWYREEEVVTNYLSNNPLFPFNTPIYASIKFINLEEARKYISDRMPVKNKKENKSRIIRTVYDIIEL